MDTELQAEARETFWEGVHGKMTTLADFTPSDYIHALVYGAPGSGKTVFAHTFPRTRTLDLDGGMGSVAWAIREGIIDKKLEDIVYETIKETDLKKGVVQSASALDWATDTLDKWLEERDEWDTLIVDSATALNELVINKGLEANAKLGLSKSKAQAKTMGIRVMKMQDWGAGMNLFSQFIEWIRSDLQDKNIVVVCHEYQNTDDAGNLIRVEPALIGQLRQRVAKDFGEVYHAEVTGSKDKPKFQLLTTQASRYVSKSRLGCLPTYMPAHYDAIRAAVDEYWK